MASVFKSPMGSANHHLHVVPTFASDTPAQGSSASSRRFTLDVASNFPAQGTTASSR